MRFIADFHIHSHYSISTSRELTPEHVELWARRKGIAVVGTGDATHPGWLQELKAKLEPAEEGLYRLRSELRLPGCADRDPLPASAPPAVESTPPAPRFLLSAEVSTIYRAGDRTRKVHHLILLPDLDAAEALQRLLSRIGNISADGRPVLGLDSRDLLEIVLQASEAACFVPAHIWTPWFSALGAKSGFDSIEECYRDLAGRIYAVETGLSSDPPMNWLCSFLDRYALISNSDAHSPEKLGREANLFDAALSYPAILEALRAGGRADGAVTGRAPAALPRTGREQANRFLGTIEFFPQEGKYHYDGHRKCGVCWEPGETLKHGGLCPQCGKPVTVGVLNRVAQLADRTEAGGAGRPLFHSLIPLKEILAELVGTGTQSREIQRRYEELIRRAGTELAVLLELPIPEVTRLGGEALGEGVRRMRAGEVQIEPGYDGEYGRITLFKPGEAKSLGPQELLFEEPAARPRRSAAGEARVGADLERFRVLKREAAPASERAPEAPEAPRSAELNAEQRKAVEHASGPALVLAGPGSGKTHTLTERIAHLIHERGVPPGHILAVTFTNKAAREMRERLRGRLGPELLEKLQVCTFHSFGLSLLKEYGSLLGRSWPFTILDEEEREELLASLPGCPKGRAGSIAERISAAKRTLLGPKEVEEPQLAELFGQYEKALAEQNAVDLDDLILLPVRLLESSPDLLQNVRTRTRWLLIDEYQDIDAAQYRLVRLLMSDPQSGLFAIGDPNQAIYGFRGADVRFIRRFREDYPQAAVYSLSTSYRCSSTILRASAQVLPAAEERLGLEGLEPGVRIRIGEHPSEASEAEFVARTIERMIGGVRFFSLDSAISGGEEEGMIRGLADFAVLCRIGRQMDSLQKAFGDHSIPYQRVGETPWFKQEPARSVFHVLKTLRSPDNRLARQRVLRCGEAVTQNLGLWRRRLAQGESLPGIIEAIGSALSERGSAGEEAIRRLAILAEEWGGEVDRFLEQAVLGSGPDAFRSGVEAVALLTLHAAKGLEFPCVFIVGCEEGLLPYSLYEERTADPAEERRLFYVGMTRAKTFLYLTHARKRMLFGREYRLPRSPFLEAIQEELAERSRAEPKKILDKNQGQQELF